jgi:NADPH:quinone reductase-like Zn-dependent oxidoreductase
LVKAQTEARVIATASRPESIAWCISQGADATIDHGKDLAQELDALGIHQLDAVFSTTITDRYLSAINQLLPPFGNLSLIDDPKVLDIAGLKRKAISVHWELTFTKAMFGYALESQGEILGKMAALVDAGRVRSIMTTRLEGLTAENLPQAQHLLKSGKGMKIPRSSGQHDYATCS